MSFLNFVMGNSATITERPAVQLVDTESQISVSTLAKPRPPLPGKEELERRLQKVFASMNLPADKIEVLRQYSDEKKWELICSQENFSAKETPEHYLNVLKVYLDPAKNGKNSKLVTQISSTEIVKDLEISLRTNSIEWVSQFLNEAHNGLDVLVEYLSIIQQHEGWDQSLDSVDNNNIRASRLSIDCKLALKPQPMKRPPRKSSMAKVRFGEVADDVHACVMCLRAIMNHPSGLNQVIDHGNAINCIVLSLNHKVLRTKTLVLELLAAICLVRRGHEVVQAAFNNFKTVCCEIYRFETLMYYFENYEQFHIDFMVACVQFFCVFIHSVEDTNFRVHLQYEFQKLGLNKFLEKLQITEKSERLSSHIAAYLDNFIDVQVLMDESLARIRALERVTELEEKLSRTNERNVEIEQAALTKLAELERQLSESQKSNQELKDLCEEKDRKLSQASNNLSAKSNSVSEQSKLRNSTTENVAPSSSSPPQPPSPVASPASAPPPPPPPPPPPLPPMSGAMTGVSASAGQSLTSGAVLPIKKVVQPKCRLPALNWVTLNPNQVKGTMFYDLNEEKLFKVINFAEFEECFKLGELSVKDSSAYVDGKMTMRRATKRMDTATLLDPNRMRNVAITRRKIEISSEELVRAINSFDLKVVPLELVDILQRVSPNEQEVKAFREYEKEQRPLSELSEEDKFMLNLVKIERLSQKLQIMSFVGNFQDVCNNLLPQLGAIVVASESVRKSSKLKKVVEIILAFGNYMNGSKRGAVYGFKLQSLDMLAETKSHDRRMSLLQFIVKTIREKFPDLRSFDSELKFVEKAATVSLENILADIVELDHEMQLTKQEYEARVEKPTVLKTFLSSSEEKMKKLKAESKAAQESYSNVLLYFGENAKTVAPHAFFSTFLRFVRAYKQAEFDLDMANKQEESQTLIQDTIRDKKRERIRGSIVAELEQRQEQIKDRGLLKEPYHGAMEDLLQGLKNEPYRRADAVRRSNKKHNGGVQRLNGNVPGNNFI